MEGPEVAPASLLSARGHASATPDRSNRATASASDSHGVTAQGRLDSLDQPGGSAG